MTIVEATRTVTGGIDTHGEVHVAAALDEVGGLLGSESFGADPDGYSALLSWLSAFGEVTRVGVEGTGSYGAGLPASSSEPESGSSKSTGRTARPADNAASPIPSTPSKQLELLCRAERMDRPRAETVRSRPSGSSSWPSARLERRGSRHSHRCASSPIAPRTSSRAASRGFPSPSSSPQPRVCGPTRSTDPVTAATKASLSSLAHRVADLEEEIIELDARITPLLESTAPELLGVYGVGIDTAAALLVAAGDNPERLRSEACVGPPVRGLAPRGLLGQSHAPPTQPRWRSPGQRALWHIVITRLASDPKTQAYMERRVKDGRSKREAIRMLKRYVAREVYRYLPRG